jgi:hypothetical protein
MEESIISNKLMTLSRGFGMSVFLSPPCKTPALRVSCRQERGVPIRVGLHLFLRASVTRCDENRGEKAGYGSMTRFTSSGR